MTDLPSSLTRSVFDAVAVHIREGNLRKGDALPSEAEIAERAGVSRTVVREAFGALSALKLIDVGNGRRPRVGAIDGSVIALPLAHAINTAQASVQQVWDARRTLERRTVMLAALRRTAAEAAAIVEHARAMRRAGADLVEQTEHDIAFHVAIAVASRNPILAVLVEAFGPIMRQTCPIGWRSRRTDAERQAVFALHDRIAAMIVEQDPEAAEAAMDAHFELSLLALINAGQN